jgi:hypothetical protein
VSASCAVLRCSSGEVVSLYETSQTIRRLARYGRSYRNAKIVTTPTTIAVTTMLRGAFLMTVRASNARVTSGRRPGDHR